MTTKHNIERRLDRLDPSSRAPVGIVITDHTVSTPWESADGDYDVEPFSQVRVWCDSRGEWHSEEVTDDIQTQS